MRISDVAGSHLHHGMAFWALRMITLLRIKLSKVQSPGRPDQSRSWSHNNLPRDRDPGFKRAPMSTGAPNKVRVRGPPRWPEMIHCLLHLVFSSPSYHCFPDLFRPCCRLFHSVVIVPLIRHARGTHCPLSTLTWQLPCVFSLSVG